uniref:Uncharacterized protein n=1 Tax=Rhizophora mucronata TaxID=61149 RepID=A0A2P2P935_RHIMU
MNFCIFAIKTPQPCDYIVLALAALTVVRGRLFHVNS